MPELISVQMKSRMSLAPIKWSKENPFGKHCNDSWRLQCASWVSMYLGVIWVSKQDLLVLGQITVTASLKFE